MAAELRSYYSPDYIHHIAAILQKEAKIKESDFVSFVLTEPWVDLTLLERAGKLTDALVHFLPGPFDRDIEILQRVLPQISGDAQTYADMLTLFVPNFVLKSEGASWQACMDAQVYFTSHGTSSELSIRPFILKDPVKTLAYMQNLATHDHPHVRRFASEGCRPRLPWAMALPVFKKDPAPVMPILEQLRADDSKFVQKSVANNLNDIAKDNPGVVLEFATKWIDTHPNTNWILKHGCRTLLKQGNRQALALFGAGPVTVTDSKLTLANNNIAYGQSVEFNFTATLKTPLPDTIRLEYAIDFMKKNGKPSRKIFKISETSATSSKLAYKKSHKFVDYTTRKHYSGSHAIAIIVNGEQVAKQGFEFTR